MFLFRSLARALWCGCHLWCKRVVVPSWRHSAVAVDLRKVVQLAGRLIQEKVRKECLCVVSSSARCMTLRSEGEVSVCFWGKRSQCASWLEPSKCMGSNVCLYTVTTRLQRDCATTVHEKMWCAVGVLSTPPVDSQEIKFPASEMTSEQ